MSSIHDADRTPQPVPCPECNTVPNVLQAGSNFGVRCPTCGMSTGCSDCTYEDAVRTWNHAVTELVTPEDLEWNHDYTGEIW